MKRKRKPKPNEEDNAIKLAISILYDWPHKSKEDHSSEMAMLEKDPSLEIAGKSPYLQIGRSAPSKPPKKVRLLVPRKKKKCMICRKKTDDWDTD